MNRTPLLLLSFAGALCVGLLPGCGDETDTTTAPPPREVPVEPTNPDRVRVRTPNPDPLPLPKVDVLTDEMARGVLAARPKAPEDVDFDTRERMRYLARLGDRGPIDELRKTMLRRADGEYEDPYLAAMGLEILLRYGEPDAPDLVIALAEQTLAEDDTFEGIASALAAIEGPRRARAEELLLEILQSDDDWAATIASEALVSRGVRADEVFERIARDEDNRVEVLRGSAVAGLLKSGSPLGKELAERLTSRDFSSSEVIDGFAIAGATQTVPYIERVVDNAFKEGDATLEFVSACYALATIYDGKANEPARDLIYGWITRDRSLDGEEASYALWALGDDGRKQAVAQVLVEHVANFESYDPELAIDILDAIAERKQANDEAFRAAVQAAAQVALPKGVEEEHMMRVKVLNAAAAHAFLRSK